MRNNSLVDALAFYPNRDGYWDSDNLRGTESQIRSLLPDDWVTKWNTESVELLTQLAHAQTLQSKLPDARETLNQTQQMISDGRSRLHSRVELRWTLEQGRMLCLSMSLAKAHELFATAWRLAEENQESFFAVDAALMLSAVRPPRFQNEWLKKALAIAESADDQNTKLWLGHLLFLDGWHSFDFRQFDSALESFDRALSRPEICGNESQHLALSWSKARTLRALTRTEEALEIQDSLLAKMSPTGKVNGHVYLEIAECKQLLKLKEEAKGFFELAYATLSANGWYSDNKADELERMKYLSKKI